MRRWTLPLLLMILLVGCRLPSMVPQAGSGTPASSTQAPSGMTLAGKILRDATVQAGFDELAQGASIALIDAMTGLTLSTSVTTPEGRFVLVFSEGFIPIQGRAYYLDLMKGIRLKAGDTAYPFNQAGADLLRMRNVLVYDGGWKSLMNAEPGNEVNIGNRSTALSVALAFKRMAGQLSSASNALLPYMGAAKDPFESVPLLEKVHFDALYEIVKDAIDKDRDPLHYVYYNEGTGEFLNSWIGFSVNKVHLRSDPLKREGKIGDPITIIGDGFDLGPPEVRVNGALATIDSVTPQKIEARIGSGSRTGPVTVKIGSITQAGQVFTVLFEDGHSAFLGGKLYVANPAWNTLVEVSEDGSVKTVLDGSTVTDLSSPRQVAEHEGMLYVSSHDNNKILRFSPANPASVQVFSTAVPKPFGLAFDGQGNLHVSSYQAAGSGGAVYTLNALGAQTNLIGGLDWPRGVAFDANGNCFVAEEQSGRIRVIERHPTTGGMSLALEPRAVVPGPMGLAVDPAGDVYVASQSNHTVYRVTPWRAVSVFAMVNSPGGICFDSRGYLFASDTTLNLIRSISPQGDRKVLAYGISKPRGLAVDPDDGSTLYVSLSESNAILQIKNQIMSPLLTGIANPQSLTYRGKGLIIAHHETGTVSFARKPPGGEGEWGMETLASGIRFPGGADRPVDASGEPAGPLYVGRYGSLTNGGIYNDLGYGVVHGQDSGIHVFTSPTAGGLQRWAFHQYASYVAGDDAGNFYLVTNQDATERSLVRIANTAETGNNSRQIRQLLGPMHPDPTYRFPEVPAGKTFDAFPVVDRDQNVYVALPYANKILRFVKSRDYAMEEITGFDKPYGMAFSDSTPAQAMFVANQGSGKVVRVSAPSAESTKAPDSEETFVINLGTTVTDGLKGLTYMKATPTPSPGNGELYMIYDDTIKRSVITGNMAAAPTTYFSPLINKWDYMFGDSTSRKIVGVMKNANYDTLTASPLALTLHGGSGGTLKALGYYGATFTQVAAYSYSSPGVTGMNNASTSRELLVVGNYLYVASPDNYTGNYGAILRIDRNDPSREMRVNIRTYSLGHDPRTDMLYAGAADRNIYRVTPEGAYSSLWTLPSGQAAFGLDVYSHPSNAALSTLWGILDNGQIFKGTLPAANIAPAPGGSSVYWKLGMSAPQF